MCTLKLLHLAQGVLQHEHVKIKLLIGLLPQSGHFPVKLLECCGSISTHLTLHDLVILHRILRHNAHLWGRGLLLRHSIYDSCKGLLPFQLPHRYTQWLQIVNWIIYIILHYIQTEAHTHQAHQEKISEKKDYSLSTLSILSST